jgi:ABC-type Zn uptake system ZnuABC Zn-binding protein ZnuA
MHRCVALLLALAVAAPAAAEPLRVCATLPDLGALVREVGGPDVALTVFAKPTEDPHFLDARPSFLKALSEAELLVLNGLDLEVGWLPVLVKNARNTAVQPGGPGYLDAATAITPLDVPTGAIDRSMGDIHPYGNPHYLTDPIDGLRVATAIAERIGTLRPDLQDATQQRLAAFRTQLGTKLFGAALAQTYDVAKLAQLTQLGKLDAFLASQGQTDQLGGWLGAMRPHRGAKAVDEHPLWPYFADRFGLDVVGHMEPKPGIPPTTKHLQELIETMQRDQVRLILASVYYDPRHAQMLADATGARIARLANLVGGRPGTDDYLSTVDYNVRQVLEALGAR